MKTTTIKSFLLFLSFSFVLVSCGGNGEHENGEETDGAEVAIMTTDEFIAEANELGKEEFEKKYPKESEIELEGKVWAPATWSDKITAKFGTGLNDLPLSADFMFNMNGGSKESTKEKVKGGELLHFKGKVSSFFFTEDGKLKYCNFSSCTAQ